MNTSNWVIILYVLHMFKSATHLWLTQFRILSENITSWNIYTWENKMTEIAYNSKTQIYVRMKLLSKMIRKKRKKSETPTQKRCEEKEEEEDCFLGVLIR